MLIKGTHIIDASGRISGNYYQKDKAGLHIKSMPRHVKSRNVAQKNTANIFLTCVNAWRKKTLTDAQIKSWHQYSNRHRCQNRLGDSYILTPQLMFYRHNMIRVRNNLPIIYDPPAD